MPEHKSDFQGPLPLVTVGLTCFNAEDTIERAIQSAVEQDWINIEIIIVDDVSCDNSVAIINRTIAGIPNARLICNKENLGPAGARNVILRAAKGEFVAFFDDDDESLPDRIQGQVDAILAYEDETQQNLVICYASGKRLYPSGYVKDLSAIGSKGGVPHGPALANYLLFFERKDQWFYGSGTPTCSLMARKTSFDLVDGFDDQLRRVEDADIAIRWALKGAHFIGTETVLFIQHASDAADKTAAKNHEAEQALALKFKNYLQSIKRFEYAFNWPTLRYAHFERRYGLLIFTLFKLVCYHPRLVPRHFLTTASRRLLHELRMNR